jgi:hypothetical protein
VLDDVNAACAISTARPAAAALDSSGPACAACGQTRIATTPSAARDSDDFPTPPCGAVLDLLPAPVDAVGSGRAAEHSRRQRRPVVRYLLERRQALSAPRSYRYFHRALGPPAGCQVCRSSKVGHNRFRLESAGCRSPKDAATTDFQHCGHAVDGHGGRWPQVTLVCCRGATRFC